MSDDSHDTELRVLGVSPDINEVLWPNTPFSLRWNLILVVRRGSEAHGTYVAPEDPDAIDDRDLLGIAVPPVQYYFGLERWDHAEAIKPPWDVVLYEVRKFVHLLCAQNPNVLCALWARPEDYLLLNSLGVRLVTARRLFRARRAALNSFLGYAQGQFKRMTAFGEFRGYMGAKRKTLVTRHGFDTKNAAHLIRLLRMGEEYLRTGELTVYREADRDELLAIKRGEVSLAAIKLQADGLFTACRTAYEHSALPLEIDWTAVRELLVDTVRQGALGAK